MELNSILNWCIPNPGEKPRERAIKLFLRKGTSFGVVEGMLYMSDTSMELIKRNHAHVFGGSIDLSD